MSGEEWAWVVACVIVGMVSITQRMKIRNLKRERAALVAWNSVRQNEAVQKALEETQRAQVAHADLHFRAVEALPDQMRYEIQLADWGPDFTGEGDTLPRWRWVIVDADRELKQVFETPPHVEEPPFMLGNENSPQLAVFSALEWIDKEQHPMVSLVVTS